MYLPDEFTRTLHLAAFGAFCTLVVLLVVRAVFEMVAPFIDTCDCREKERK